MSYPTYSLKIVKPSTTFTSSTVAYMATNQPDGTKAMLHTIINTGTNNLYLLETTSLDIVVYANQFLSSQAANMSVTVGATTYTTATEIQNYLASATYRNNTLVRFQGYPSIAASSGNVVWSEFLGEAGNNKPKSGTHIDAYQVIDGVGTYLASTGYKGIKVYTFFFWSASQSLLPQPTGVVRFPRPYILLDYTNSLAVQPHTGKIEPLLSFPNAKIPPYDYDLQDLENPPTSITNPTYAGSTAVAWLILERNQD